MVADLSLEIGRVHPHDRPGDSPRKHKLVLSNVRAVYSQPAGAAGSENSDLNPSGNSGRSEPVPPRGTLAVSHSEGKDDRHAQAGRVNARESAP